MQDIYIDGLVNEITARVKQRLNGEKPSDAPCVAGQPGPECESCQGCHVQRADDVRDIIQIGASRIGAGPGNVRPDSDLAGYIDHTLLKPEASREELRLFCEEALKFGFASVCVNASNIKYCASLLQGSNVLPIAVVGFPLGAMTPSAKGFEAREAVRNGAKEIDMVINIGGLKSKDYSLVLEDIASVVGAAQAMPVKVILENASLTRDEKVIGCVLSKIGGAAFVKTSTGFGVGGATTEDVGLMREIVGKHMGVKASGGVRTTEDAKKMIEAGATRIGASASVQIVTTGAGTNKAKKSSRLVGGGY